MCTVKIFILDFDFLKRHNGNNEQIRRRYVCRAFRLRGKNKLIHSQSFQTNLRRYKIVSKVFIRLRIVSVCRSTRSLDNGQTHRNKPRRIHRQSDCLSTFPEYFCCTSISENRFSFLKPLILLCIRLRS